LAIADKRGQPLAVDNKKNFPNNQQYFPQVPDVIRAMKRGLELLEAAKKVERFLHLNGNYTVIYSG